MPPEIATIGCDDASLTDLALSFITVEIPNRLLSLKGKSVMTVLYGTNVPDALTGTVGNDQIFGWAQSNLPGNEGPARDADNLRGGAGNDVLRAGNGADQLRGDAGDDVCYGGAGNDTIIPGVLFDIPDGGNDVLYGDAGDDWLSGGVGNDRLFGGTGNDFLEGRGGNNTLFGGDGNDSISLTINGLAANMGSAANTADGGTGIDLLVIKMTDAKVGATLSFAIPAQVINFINGNVFSGFEVLDFAGGSGIDRIIGSGLHDRIFGGLGNDVLQGGAGNDTLGGDEGADWIYGGAGDDDLQGGAGNDVIFGGIGNDYIYISSEPGADTIDGGAGIDRIELDRSLYTQSISLSLAGPAISQVLVGGIRVVGIEQLTLIGGSGNDNITGGAFEDGLFGGVGNDTFNGAAGSDYLDGGAGNDRLEGGLGADTFLGGMGNDILIVDNAADVIYENNTLSEGIDTVVSFISFSLSGAQVNGIVENLSLVGNAVFGTGNAVANVIAGNLLANTLTGGGGQDRFVFRTTLGTVDRITDFSVVDDSILLDDAVFTGLTGGVLSLSAFHVGTNATDLSDRIIYNSATGALFYDANGSATGSAVHFATLATGLALTSADIFVF
jgi:serralysin